MSSKKPAGKPAATKAPAKAPTKGAAKKPAPAKGGGGAKAAPAAAAAPPAKPKAPPLPVSEIGLKQLNVVLGDTTGKIKESGRWPLIIDESGNVMTFLRHRDCNNIDMLDQAEMQPERIRQALLGGIRYGKPMTVNLHEAGDIEVVKDRFDEIMPDLFDMLLSKQILEDDRYMKLVRKNDDADYQMSLFAVQDGFSFVFISENPELTENTLSKVIVFKIV